MLFVCFITSVLSGKQIIISCSYEEAPAALKKLVDGGAFTFSPLQLHPGLPCPPPSSVSAASPRHLCKKQTKLLISSSVHKVIRMSKAVSLRSHKPQSTFLQRLSLVGALLIGGLFLGLLLLLLLILRSSEVALVTT